MYATPKGGEKNVKIYVSTPFVWYAGSQIQSSELPPTLKGKLNHDDNGYYIYTTQGTDSNWYRKNIRFSLEVSYINDSGNKVSYTVWPHRRSLYYGHSGLGADDKNFEVKGESLWDKIVAVVKAIIKFFKEIVSKVLNWIFSKLIYAICNGIRKCINAALGQPGIKGHAVTIDQIVNNKCALVSTDYWNPPHGSVPEVVQGVVEFWYVKFRQIAITCYLIMLLYLGIRIMISKNATNLEAIKERLNTWLIGVIALFFFPYLMLAIFDINNAVIKFVKDESRKALVAEGLASTENVDMMDEVLKEAKESIVCGIIYIIMTGELIVMLFAYYKRAFTIGFLITFFPIVCIKHLFDGINSRRQRACIRCLA